MRWFDSPFVFCCGGLALRTKRLLNRRALVPWAVLLAKLCSVISQLCHLSIVAVYACVCLLAVCACVVITPFAAVDLAFAATDRCCLDAVLESADDKGGIRSGRPTRLQVVDSACSKAELLLSWRPSPVQANFKYKVFYLFFAPCILESLWRVYASANQSPPMSPSVSSHQSPPIRLLACK